MKNWIPCFYVIPILLIGTWWVLHDLPVTSKGGFWHYFWWVYVGGGIAWISLEVWIRKSK